MAHKLMVPAGFKECIPRGYDCMLAGERPLSPQDGCKEEAKTNNQILNGKLTGPRKFIGSAEAAVMPEWYELVNYMLGKDEEAREFENPTTGEQVRVIAYKKLRSMCCI